MRKIWRNNGFSIPKKRTFLIGILMFLITITVIGIGIMLIKRIIISSFDAAIEAYDVQSEEMAVELYKDIEGDCQSLNVSAQLIGQKGNIDKDQIAEILPLLVKGSTFYDLSIINKNGTGYNLTGKNEDISDEDYFITAKSGQIIVDSLYQGNEAKAPVLIYTVPIFNKNEFLGVLTAKKNLQLDNFIQSKDGMKENSVFYIVDGNNKMVFNLNGENGEGLNYDRELQEGFFHTKKKEHNSKRIYNDFFGIGNEKNEVVVWYKKPLEISGWSLLVGKTDVLNPFTQNIIRITNTTWVCILAGILLFFLLLAIIQGKSNKKLTQMLYLDPVTGGGNWYRFRVDANRKLNSRQFLKKKYALVNFDINRFKVINDSFGHLRGDEVLKDVYYVIKKWAKKGELYTRYAADQFYILLSFDKEEELTERLLDLNNRLHHLKNTKTVKFYFGVYFITERKDSIDRMGDFAGTAKNKIKGNNDEIISFFDDKAKVRLLEEENIEKNMQDALSNNKFIVYLQPKYTTAEERISGAEALVRWDKGDGSFISPGYFIPVFEKNGFIIELDHYMLENVCRLQKKWIEKGYTPLPVSVNVSRINFSNPHLADMIKGIVDEYQVPHELIELELTESAFLQNKQIIISTVTELKNNGFLVSMDDFGAGYSSLNSLKDLPLDVVKLDGEMFRITKEIERGQSVIRNTILMAKDLHMKVVAECIETREQVEFLNNVGCDIIQGFYYAKPMPVEQFELRYLAG